MRFDYVIPYNILGRAFSFDISTKNYYYLENHNVSSETLGYIMLTWNCLVPNFHTDFIQAEDIAISKAAQYLLSGGIFTDLL